ncbi:MAG: HDIG domain-containing protein [Acidimicrobiia bacterium]|nr:HDIG domain-containing protein [Acidimicrobiia bacterium]
MTSARSRVWLIRAGVLVVTIAATFGLLAINQQTRIDELVVGDPSPKTFIAPAGTDDIVVPDPVLTEAARREAADGVARIFSVDPSINAKVLVDIEAVFDAVRDGVFLPADQIPALTPLPESTPTAPTSTTEPEPTGTTVAGDSTTTTVTTLPPEPAVTQVSGFAFIDADTLGVDPDGLFEPEDGDLPLPRITVVLVDGANVEHTTETGADGAFNFADVVVGTIRVGIDGQDRDFPEGFGISTEPWLDELTATENAIVDLPAIGFRPFLTTLETQEAALSEATLLDAATVETLVRLAIDDVMRRLEGSSVYLAEVEDAALRRANELLGEGLDGDQVLTARQQLRAAPPLVRLDGESNEAAGVAAGEIVSDYLLPNRVYDETATEAARQAAADAVEDEMATFRAGSTIVLERDILTAAALNAIDSAKLHVAATFEYYQLAAVVALTVIVVMIYLARFRPTFWAASRRVTLFGILIVLASAGARGAVAMESVFDVLTGLAGYAVPAAALGFMAAILFDPRIGVLVALVTSVLTALATGDSGFAAFALVSAMAPILFVSSISTRGDLRRAILYSSVAVSMVAAVMSWFFHSPGTDDPASIVMQATLIAFVTTLATSLVALAALSFFESAFDITTTLRLLDVIDRNHPALQLLQEEAWGSFNHSLMVGTLVDKAARSIGANNLLALAAAYYHDLGKTQNPAFFIENQFGISNPHDLLPPEESAEVIRKHVTDGIALARQYRIPSEVAEGILSHHGDGIMQYFYQKARARYGDENVDVETYRHAGHKPLSKEMAILMMADALEGAVRAVFQDEDPSPDSIRAVCDRVVGEKVADGQLTECDLTMGDLTKVKDAFVDALIGHYHQRIPYPNFPGSVQTSAEPPPDEPSGAEAPESDTSGQLTGRAREDGE